MGAADVRDARRVAHDCLARVSRVGSAVLEVCRYDQVFWSVSYGFNNDVRLPMQLACKLVTGCEDAADEECIEFAVILVEAGVSSTPRGMISPQFELASLW